MNKDRFFQQLSSKQADKTADILVNLIYTLIASSVGLLLVPIGNAVINTTTSVFGLISALILYRYLLHLIRR